jgi:hypothetical protein
MLSPGKKAQYLPSEAEGHVKSERQLCSSHFIRYASKSRQRVLGIHNLRHLETKDVGQI